MHQQFFYTHRIFIKNISLFIWADVHTINKHFAVFNTDKGFFYAAFSHSQGFNLCSVKRNPCLIRVFDKIIMICFFVVCNQFYGFGSHPYVQIRKNVHDTSLIRKWCLLKHRQIFHHAILHNVFHDLIYEINLPASFKYARHFFICRLSS